MDRTNPALLARVCPAAQRSKIRLMTEFSYYGHMREVPAPYREGLEGIEPVLDLLEDAARGLLDALDSADDPRFPRAGSYL